MYAANNIKTHKRRHMSKMESMRLRSGMKGHVAVLPSPGLGHVIPFLELSKRLVTLHGFHVTFLNITTTEPFPARDRLLHPSNLPPALHVVNLPPVDSPAVDNILSHLSLVIGQSLGSLSAVLSALDNKPATLLIDLFCTDAFHICKPLSIPVYTFFIHSANFLAFSLYFPTLGLPPLVDRVSIPGCSSIRASDLLETIPDRSSDEYKWIILQSNRLTLSAGILVNSWEDLEPVPLQALRDHPFFQQLPAPPIYAIGPVIKAGEPDTSDCVAWLDKQAPGTVVYVSPGSSCTLTAEQLRELALGLELSQQRFLWVVKRPSDTITAGTYLDAGRDVEHPNAYLPEGFAERTEGKGMVVLWAPQVAVLGHPATGAFVSQCGWNSALESMANGVPMIGWPLHADQGMIVTMLEEEIGVAVKVGKGEGGLVTRTEVDRVVRMVMEGERGKLLTRRAKHLKESAAKAMASSDSLSLVAKQWIHGLPIIYGKNFR